MGPPGMAVVLIPVLTSKRPTGNRLTSDHEWRSTGGGGGPSLFQGTAPRRPVETERQDDHAGQDFPDRERRLLSLRTCRDEGTRCRVARRGQEGGQEGRRAAGGPGRDGQDDAGGPGHRRARPRDHHRKRAGVVGQNLVRDARLHQRRRQGRRRVQELGEVRHALLDPGVPGSRPPGQRGHLGGVVRAADVEPGGGEEGGRADASRGVLMPGQETEVLIVGAGQAGLAMSEHLSGHGVPHLVLERGRIAERWRSERWDSLVANGPAWHDRFPGLEFPGLGPDDFAPKERVADYFAAYADKIGAPVRCGVDVRSVAKNLGRPGFAAETSDGVIDAQYVVAAAGPFQRPVIPALGPGRAGLVTIHSSSYRNPRQLPGGAVLVIGAGASGVQIADELQRSGRQVHLSVGPHDRPPRRYRGRDYCWWLGVLGKWDIAPPPAGARHVPIAVSGAHGGAPVASGALPATGIPLAGRTTSFGQGTMRFAPDLGDNIARGDAYYLSLLDECDAYVDRNGLDLPEEPGAHVLGPDPECLTQPVLELHLAAAGVPSIVWATG